MRQIICWKLDLKKQVDKGKSHCLEIQTVQKLDEFTRDALNRLMSTHALQ